MIPIELKMFATWGVGLILILTYGQLQLECTDNENALRIFNKLISSWMVIGCLAVLHFVWR